MWAFVGAPDLAHWCSYFAASHERMLARSAIGSPTVITPGTFVAALRDMVDPARDGPRDEVTFAYRGSVYVRLAQFQEWLAAHGQDGSQAAARAVMNHYGFVRAPFTVRDAQGEVTSRSVYRSMNPDLVEELPEWPGPRMGSPGEAGDPPDDDVDDSTPGNGHGRLTAAQRFIIEKHAEDLVDAHYTAAGWAVRRVGDQRIGWDLTVTRAGDPNRHVEVKGTRGPGDEVELTANELAKAREHPGNAVLAIAAGIELVGDIPAGGTVVLIDPWDPEEEHLAATRFRYRPPHVLRVAAE